MTLGELNNDTYTPARFIELPDSDVAGLPVPVSDSPSRATDAEENAAHPSRAATARAGAVGVGVTAADRIYTPTSGEPSEAAAGGGYDGMFEVSDAGSSINIEDNVSMALRPRGDSEARPVDTSVEVVERDYDGGEVRPALTSLVDLDAERARLDLVEKNARGREEKRRAKEERGQSERRNAGVRKVLEEEARAIKETEERERVETKARQRTLDQNAADARLAKERAAEKTRASARPAKRGLFGKKKSANPVADAADEQGRVDRDRVSEAERLTVQRIEEDGTSERKKAREASKARRAEAKTIVARRKSEEQEARKKAAAAKVEAREAARVAKREAKSAPKPTRAPKPKTPTVVAPTAPSRTTPAEPPPRALWLPVFPDATQPNNPPVADPKETRRSSRRERRHSAMAMSDVDREVADEAQRARELKELDEEITNEKVAEAARRYEVSQTAILAAAKRREIAREQNGIDLPRVERSRLRRAGVVLAVIAGVAGLAGGVAVGATQSDFFTGLLPTESAVEGIAVVPYLEGSNGEVLRVTRAWADDSCGVGVMVSTLGAAGAGTDVMTLDSLTFTVNGTPAELADAGRSGCEYADAFTPAMAGNATFFLTGVTTDDVTDVTVGTTEQVTEWSTPGPGVTQVGSEDLSGIEG